ncbi:MAG: hypothetical protein IT385_12620 [Deltaproteobacteria bacterium]|nr:hypothetical protein [Deltaproteobacteria bacterium]
MNDWRPTATLGALALGLVAATLAPRPPTLVHLAGNPNGTSAGGAVSLSAAECLTVYSATALFVQSATPIGARYHYVVCGPAALTDDWSVEARAPGVARWRVSGVAADCDGGVERCTFELGPWESAAVIALDAAGQPLAAPGLVIGFRGAGLNLRASDLLRLALVALIALGIVRVCARATAPWSGRGAEVTLLGVGLMAGALAATRPVGWGGAADALGALTAVAAGAAVVIGARMSIGWMRGPITTALVVLAVVAAATTLASALGGSGWPHARELQRVVIVSATAWTALVAASGRGAPRAWLVGTVFGVGAVALEVLTRPPMPYPGIHGVYQPWELVTAGWPMAAMAHGLARIRGIAARPAAWTRRVAEPLARLGRGEGGAAARARLEALVAPRATWPAPNRATAGFVFAARRALGRPIATRPPIEADATSAPIVLFDATSARCVRGEVRLVSEPRAALLEGELALVVYDRERRAPPSLAADVGAVLDAIDARVGASGLALERTSVRFEHPGDALVGSSFELALALAWYGLRARRSPRLPGVVATGRLAPDRDTVLGVDHLAAKIDSLARGEIMLVPGAEAEEARRVPDVVVLDAAQRSAWGTRRRARALARGGARVVIAVPTLGAALRVAFGERIT